MLLQISGTNYLKSVLKKNFRVKFLNNNEDGSYPLQKHFWVYNEKEIIPESAYKNNIIVSNLKDFEAELKEVPDNYILVSKIHTVGLFLIWNGVRNVIGQMLIIIIYRNKIFFAVAG